MRLLDLDPRWCGLNQWVSPERPFRIGLSFLCPHCHEQRLAILFDPPVNPTRVDVVYNAQAYAGDRYVWQRSGDTFDTLTLTPSIDASKFGHWHGRITAGEVK